MLSKNQARCRRGCRLSAHGAERTQELGLAGFRIVAGDCSPMVGERRSASAIRLRRQDHGVKWAPRGFAHKHRAGAASKWQHPLKSGQQPLAMDLHFACGVPYYTNFPRPRNTPLADSVWVSHRGKDGMFWTSPATCPAMNQRIN